MRSSAGGIGDFANDNHRSWSKKVRDPRALRLAKTVYEHGDGLGGSQRTSIANHARTYQKSLPAATQRETVDGVGPASILSCTLVGEKSVRFRFRKIWKFLSQLLTSDHLMTSQALAISQHTFSPPHQYSLPEPRYSPLLYFICGKSQYRMMEV